MQEDIAIKSDHYKQNHKQWMQFKKDFNKINNWLDKAEETLNSQSSGVGIEDLEDSFKKYRVSCDIHTTTPNILPVTDYFLW